MSGILIPFTKEQIQCIYNILNVTEEDVQKSLELLKEWYMQQPHLPKRYVDTAFLRTVILGSKNRIEIAKQRIENLFFYRNLYPDFFMPRSINDFPDKLALLTRFFIVLPKGTPDGYRVVILRPKYDNLIDLSSDIWIPGNLMDIEITEDATFGGAVIVIYDFININQMGLIRIAGAIKYSGIVFNELIPCVIKKIMFINVGTITQQAVNLFKTVLKNKITKKIVVLGKDNIEKLFEDIPKEIFPVDYGGLEESYDTIREKYYDRMVEMHDLFMDSKNFSADETLRPKNFKNPHDNEFGVEGTFKTLNVD